MSVGYGFTSFTLRQEELHAGVTLPRGVGAAPPPPQLVLLVETQTRQGVADILARAAHACLGVRVAGDVSVFVVVVDVGVDISVVGRPALCCQDCGNVVVECEEQQQERFCH